MGAPSAAVATPAVVKIKGAVRMLSRTACRLRENSVGDFTEGPLFIVVMGYSDAITGPSPPLPAPRICAPDGFHAHPRESRDVARRAGRATSDETSPFARGTGRRDASTAAH